MRFKSSNTQELIKLRRQEYNATKNTYCPLIKDVVYFNNHGFFHATHDGRGRIRGEADAKMRLNLLSRIVRVINNANGFNRPPILVPKNDENNYSGKEVIFYELLCRMGRGAKKKSIIVVLRRIGKGRIHYYSVRYGKRL